MGQVIMNGVSASVHAALAAAPAQERAPGAIGMAAREAAHAKVMENPGKALGVARQSAIEAPVLGGKIEPPTERPSSGNQQAGGRNEEDAGGTLSLMQTFSRMGSIAG